MRKPRDYDAELKSLDDKARLLRERKVKQLGELVIGCGADAMPIEQLAGALLIAAEAKEPVAKEAHRERGAAFFQAKSRTVAKSGRSARSAEASNGASE